MNLFENWPIHVFTLWADALPELRRAKIRCCVVMDFVSRATTHCNPCLASANFFRALKPAQLKILG